MSLIAATIGATLLSAGASAWSQWQQGKANLEAAKNNANALRKQAGQVWDLGLFDAMQHQEGVARFASYQEAGLAASGMRLGEGVAEELVQDTYTKGGDDLATLIGNIGRQTDVLTTQADNILAQGKRYNANGIIGAGATLLSGGAQAWSVWQGRPLDDSPWKPNAIDKINPHRNA